MVLCGIGSRHRRLKHTFLQCPDRLGIPELRDGGTQLLAIPPRRLLPSRLRPLQLSLLLLYCLRRCCARKAYLFLPVCLSTLLPLMQGRL